MGIDYYGVLSLKKNSTDLEIKKAFRRLAIHYNPERQKDRGVQAVFSLIAEAYDVLSDPFKRAIYDQYGEEGLKRGVPGPQDYIQPYVFHGDPLRTYRDFFGTSSPYADLLDVLANPLPLYELPEGRGIKRKEEPLIKPLLLTLNEVFFGGVKKMKIQRLVLSGDGKSATVPREKILTIPIKPGLPSGTEILFPEEGDQGPTKIPADIIFVTEDRPHDTFVRDGSNLLMIVDVFLREALTGFIVTVNTIDERILRVPITSVVSPGYEKLVIGEGLPLVENPKERGDLIIRFNIEFPAYMPNSSKNYVKKAFRVSSAGGEKGDAEYIQRLILADKLRRNIDSDIPLRRESDDDEKRQLRDICNP
ncbi:dnaJ homolog subfamily B member 13 [Neodiprion pinetum]|uniref:DnaJ homolog subfamily B member 13-like n=1 Tax=Neodiprion lecontei TaxID=441921 RepID=A0A6J0BFQ1_NEOLC|nr:dnaJ homolog subfamily B member 13-like [Neodiprion lecontei]XP_046493409.1 dnaJ homolog subfamily B member 13-like [Neodiprion pinetum]